MKACLRKLSLCESYFCHCVRMQQVSIAYCQFGVTALCKLSGHYVNCWTFCKLSGWYDGNMQIAGHYANCLVGMMAFCKLLNEGDILQNA